MLNLLRLLFGVVLVSMLCVTTWASLQCPLFGVPRPVATHPWFIATLFDAYWGFVTFLVWVGYKEASWTARIAWLAAVLTLGNIAMASYCLRELFNPPASGRVQDLLVRRNPAPGWLGPCLAGAGIAVTALAARGAP